MNSSCRSALFIHQWNWVIFTTSSSYRLLSPLMIKYLNFQNQITSFKLSLDFETKYKTSVTIFMSNSVSWNAFQDGLCLLLLLTLAVWFYFMYVLHAPGLHDAVFSYNNRTLRDYESGLFSLLSKGNVRSNEC